MFGSQKRPGMRGTNSLNMGAYYGYGSDQLIVSPSVMTATNNVQAATTTTSPLYKWGMSPMLWALAAAAVGGGYLYLKKRKR